MMKDSFFFVPYFFFREKEWAQWDFLPKFISFCYDDSPRVNTIEWAS